MIGSLWVVRGLWGLAVAGLLVATSGIGTSPSGVAADAAPVLPRVDLRRPSADSLAVAAETIAEGNLFRADRGSVEITPVNAAPVMSAPPPSIPRLLLRGLVGGPAWQAIIEGLPGTDGAVVMRPGETRDGITLRAVRRDTAILVTKDTTWKLTVGRAW